ncbi:MAG: amidohydrolase family protein [Sandaracinaceae bacterium]|nr:amidohydrolase family protein [Sandaracinaceae bacterium]
MRRALVLALLLLPAVGARADVDVDGTRVEVIDPHLHPGTFGRIAERGRGFIVDGLPPFARLYAPALIDRLLDPWAPHIGIRAQADWAGIDQVLLLAVYTPQTTGFFENAALDERLAAPRNADGWARGLASVRFDVWSPENLEHLESWLEAHPERFAGIKLAHAHQAVTFDDPEYLGVYDVAARQGVPVLLHTGFSPFPGSQTDPAYYDPSGLAAVIEAYDGAHGMGRVDFVLSHVGQGDARAVAHAIELAAAHDNVWLELSALGRPTLIDASGEPATSSEPQYPYVLEQVLARDLVDRTMFATDGPQFSGMMRRYVQTILGGLRDAGYTVEQIAAVMGGNARALFFERRP